MWFIDLKAQVVSESEKEDSDSDDVNIDKSKLRLDSDQVNYMDSNRYK